MRHRQPSRAVQGCRNLKVRVAEGAAPVVLLPGSNTRKPRALNAAASSPVTNFTSPKIVPSQHKPHARQMGAEAAALDFFEALNASYTTPRQSSFATQSEMNAKWKSPGKEWSERQDLNLRRLGPKPSALARLSYAPVTGVDYPTIGGLCNDFCREF